MARENFRKVKLLKLLEMLQLGSDEQHPLTTSHITARLEQMGIPCDRRTLAQDIALLTELDYEIMTTTVGHEKGYYVEDRNFSIPELKILIDAVHASSFITEKKSDELIGKIAALAGSHRAEVLKRGMVAFNTRKHSNEKIFYNVDRLEKAILDQKQVSFQYFDLNEGGEKVYRREGSRYTAEPVALVFNEDNYYLTCYSPVTTAPSTTAWTGWTVWKYYQKIPAKRPLPCAGRLPPTRSRPSRCSAARRPIWCWNLTAVSSARCTTASAKARK